MKAISRSLRFRLVLASIVVEVVMLALLVGNSIRINRAALLDQANTWVGATGPLLNASLAAPLAQRDYATLQGVLAEIRSDQALSYLVLTDRAGAVVASSGWPADKALPPADAAIDVADGDSRFDTRLPIALAGQQYGTLQVGLDIGFMDEARRRLLVESLVIGAVEVVLSVLLLWGIGYFLTRHLKRLTEAGEAMARGNLAVRVDIRARDEVGQLASVFNTMARAVEERLAQMRASEAKFHAIADYSTDCELWLSPTGRLLWINPRVLSLTGYTVEECLDMIAGFPIAVAVPQDATALRLQLDRAFSGASASDVTFRIRRKDGGELWASADWRPIYDAEGAYIGVRLSIHDISQRKEAEDKLSDTLNELEKAYAIQREYLTLASEERARLNALLAAMHIGILFVDRDNKVIYSNPAFEQIWMVSNSKVRFVGQDAHSVLSNVGDLLAKPDRHGRSLLQLPNGESAAGGTVEIEMVDGRLVTQMCHAVRDSAQHLVGHLWLYEDVTRERQTAEQLLYLAERDALTGLYNRHRFQDELNRMLSDGDRHKSSVALLFFDIDEFKYINDNFGHRAGDAMLIRVAGEVSAQVRRNEIFARLGGDEFAILAPEATEQESTAFAERIVRAISRIPFSYEGHNLRLTCSLGVALYPTHAANSEDLVAFADLAMYQAKEAGKNTWRIYREDQGASQAVITRLNWNDRIQHALENNLLTLHFQGIFDCMDSSLRHVEALVRMRDKVEPGRLIMPGHFIPVAEKTGKILDIDRWVIAEVVRMLSLNERIPPIAVNISGRSFNEPQLPRFIEEELKRAGVRPERLMVELTETSAVSDLHDAKRFIEALRDTGCKVCLDDFGAGFSSFAYLKHIEADVLKIDGQFIRDLPNDRSNQVFVKAIVDVARGLNKVSVAECVEDEATLVMLRALGVDCAQGYHLERPLEFHPALRR
jgi:diguanylate cyclase (GGDEF)-like protein/PAS domain S-box-containing protein